MKIKVQLNKEDAVKLGVETWGELHVELDLAQLSQAERDYLAPSQSIHSPQGRNMELEYVEQGYTRRQLFPPTTEGVMALLRFGVEKETAYKAYQAAEAAKRKAKEEAEATKQRELRERLIAHLLTLPDGEFMRAVAPSYIDVPGTRESVRSEYVLKDTQLAPQMDRRNRVLAENKRRDEAAEAQKRVEQERKAAAKRQQIAAWVAEKGTESQRKRQNAELLDEQEVIDAMRDEAFASLANFSLYEKLHRVDVEHTDDCQWSENVEFSAENAFATEATFAQLEQMQALLPGATITTRRHTAQCESCKAETVRDSLLVKITVGEFEFTRDYGVPEAPDAVVERVLPEE